MKTRVQGSIELHAVTTAPVRYSILTSFPQRSRSKCLEFRAFISWHRQYVWTTERQLLEKIGLAQRCQSAQHFYHGMRSKRTRTIASKFTGSRSLSSFIRAGAGEPDADSRPRGTRYVGMRP